MRLTEPEWDLSERSVAVQRLQSGKCGDELGLTGELLKNAAVKFLPFSNCALTMSWCFVVTAKPFGPQDSPFPRGDWFPSMNRGGERVL